MKTLAAFVLAGLLCASAGAATPAVRDSKAGLILQESAWARENGVAGTACTGVGRAQGSGARIAHTSFRCRVAIGANATGVVVVQPLGPEWLHVSRVVEGKLGPDRGIGEIPKGRPTLESFWAGGALQDGAWAKAHGVGTAFCYGVGAYDHYAEDGWFFYAYSCATLDADGKRGAQVLVTVAPDTSDGAHAVRVVRTLSR